jgi:AcrR family transcriptional regulator
MSPKDATADKIEPRWERRKDARPAELANAALELFVERGFSATRLEDVAARAGVSKGTLYLYFDSKEDLFRAVIRGAIAPAIEDAEKMLTAPDTPAEQLLRCLIWGWWDEILSKTAGGIPKLLLAEAGNFPELADFYYEQVVQRGTALFRQVIERGVAQGEFRPINIDNAVHVMMAPMIMLAVSRHSVDFCGREHRDPRAVIETYLDMVVRALRNDGAGERS